MAKNHNNRPLYRPWEDAGLFQTNTLGKVRLWTRKLGESWDVAIASYCIITASSREEALSLARNK